MADLLGSRPPPASRPPVGKGPEPPGSRTGVRGVIFIALLLTAIWTWTHFAPSENALPSVSYTAFYAALEAKNVESVVIKGQDGIATADWVGEHDAIPVSAQDY